MFSKSPVILWALLAASFPLSLAFSPLPRSPPTHSLRQHHTDSTMLHLSSSSNYNNQSAASKERRQEEKRRLERKTDVVIGKTSAKTEAKDFALNPKATQEEWMRQASNVEQKVFRETEKGMEFLKMLQLEEASEAFDRVFELRPDAYLWQAGIAKFYLGDLQGAAEIFSNSVHYYETKFLEPASEERIWRDACELKLASSMEKAEKKDIDKNGGVSSRIAQITERSEDEGPLNAETRKVLRIARDLFAATIEGNHGAEVLARAKLRAICGTFDDKLRFDPKMWRLSAWFYLGLHYDVVGDEDASRECMKNALRLCPSSGNADDMIHTLPLLHMARRDLFDDDEFEEMDDSTERSKAIPSRTLDTANGGVGISSDPVFIESMRSSISKLKLVELQAALKARGLKFHFSKDVLKEKLFRSLLENSGLDEYQ